MIEFRMMHFGGARTKGNSKMAIGGRVIIPKAQRDAEKKIRAEAHRHRPDRPFAGAVIVGYLWAFKIPKTGPNKDAQPGDVHLARPDVENCAKLWNDALQGLFWVDDCLVAPDPTPGRNWIKIWDREAYTRVWVRPARIEAA